MKDDYVSFEIADLLNDKSFDEWCHAVWFCNPKQVGSESFVETDNKVCNIGLKKGDEPLTRWAVSAPTYQQVFRWLREKHNIFISVGCDICDSFDFYSMVYIKGEESWKTVVDFEDEGSESFKQAAEKSIKYCLTELIV